MTFEQFWEAWLCRNPEMRRLDDRQRVPISLSTLKGLIEQAWQAGSKHEMELADYYNRRSDASFGK
jgi:hypothetical protein